MLRRFWLSDQLPLVQRPPRPLASLPPQPINFLLQSERDWTHQIYCSERAVSHSDSDGEWKFGSLYPHIRTLRWEPFLCNSLESKFSEAPENILSA